MQFLTQISRRHRRFNHICAIGRTNNHFLPADPIRIVIITEVGLPLVGPLLQGRNVVYNQAQGGQRGLAGREGQTLVDDFPLDCCTVEGQVQLLLQRCHLSFSIGLFFGCG